MIADKDKIVWKDRKRIFGLPITMTRYFVDDDRLYIKTGFFKTEVNELLLYRILDIKSSRTLGQKLFGVGTIILYCADQSDRTLKLENIKNSEKIHKFISNTVERERKERGIIGKELFGTAGHDMGTVGDDCCNDGDDCDCDCEHN